MRIVQEIETVRWLPVGSRVFGPHLQEDQIGRTAEVPEHRRERFPIEPLVIDADPAPGRTVFRDLPKHCVDRGYGLAGADLTGDQPATAETEHIPGEAAQPENGRRLHTPPHRATK